MVKMEPEFRWYYDENGTFVGAIFDTDPFPPQWSSYSYTLITPPSVLAGGNYTSIVETFNGTKWVYAFDITRLKNYRDSKIEVELSYNNDSDEFNIMNKKESSEALGKICSGLLLIKDETPVAWKNLDGMYVEATYSDMQGLFKACYQREQLCRTAEKFVLDKNEVTPYIDIDDAYADFNTQIGE